MVAYSFAPMFEVAVASLQKQQTVRSHRKRHARAGEAMQLFMGMRTKRCRKLLATDPICRDVRRIAIDIAPRNPLMIVSIEIEGIPLSAEEIESFAIADGFAADDSGRSARQNMGLFWLKHHPGLSFDGVVIRWEPR